MRASTSIAICVVSLILYSCGNSSKNENTRYDEAIATQQREIAKLEQEKAQQEAEKQPTLPTPVLITVDGFKAVNIGNQVWMVENLNTTVYRNGESVPYLESTKGNLHQWEKLSNEKKEPTCCSFKNEYGKLYNWYAVNDPRQIAPVGWHIPSIQEWSELVDNLGGPMKAADALKSNYAWKKFLKSDKADNSSLFNALPGGFAEECPHDGVCFTEGIGTFWTSTPAGTEMAKNIVLVSGYATMGVNQEKKDCGMSVRCVKD